MKGDGNLTWFPSPFIVCGVLSVSRWFLTDKSSSSGIGWLGNEYSLVGNKSVGLIDPWGLSPISADLVSVLLYCIGFGLLPG